ncbi:hypothetical protein PGT21_027161 [Puccinia graminis f. sp. tritici]|uniref:Uncharacterized protein n=1 Tax=Puccinia graminis f. sp. tritici TaxID=56615 RepID=A0A5B0PZ30_PUCGR|nr:hypothetical protein PGT21_027161 [Puccinia graminis f. sp. tritici]
MNNQHNSQSSSLTSTPPIPFKIQDSNLWSLQNNDTSPILGHLFDLFTPAPRGDKPDAASWLIFEGRFIASYSNTKITVMCQSSSYHFVLPPRIRSLPHPLLTGDFKLIDHGTKTMAFDPDVSDSCLFRIAATCPTISRQISSTSPGTVVHISGYLLDHKKGIVDVELEQKINPGSTYGQLFYSTSVAFTDTKTQAEKNILVKLCGYGSAITALIENHVYLVSGRFIPRNIKTTPVFHYDTNTTLDLGETTQLSQSIADKSTVIGLGVVVSKKEVLDADSSSAGKILHVILQHTDYDPLVVQFKTLYYVGGRKNLANTFGLFQIGREVLISGNIVGYSEDLYMWIINAISVSVTSGSQSGVTSTSELGHKSNLPSRRPGLISIEDPGESLHTEPVRESIMKPKDVPSKAELDSIADSPCANPGGSENYYATITPTSGKKRTQKQILADAKRAKKTLGSTPPL